MLEVLHMNTHDQFTLNSLSNGGPGPGPGGLAAQQPPRKSTSLITNQAIVKSALANAPRKSANSKKEGNNSRRANKQQQRSETAPNCDSPTKTSRKNNKTKSDSEVFPNNYSPIQQSKSSSASSSSVSLLAAFGGTNSGVASSDTLTQPPPPTGPSSARKKRTKPATGGVVSPVRQQAELSTININSVQTPKASRKKKGGRGDELKTPDKRYENNNPNFDDDSNRDLKEILFPELYGTKSTPVRQRNIPQTPGNNNKQQPRLPINGPPPFTPKRGSPPGDLFAGSSFHNSPAPSALPKPSFKGKTSCTLYADNEQTTAPTPFERLISNKLAANNTTTPTFDANNATLMSSSSNDNFSLENDLKRILNVNQG